MNHSEAGKGSQQRPTDKQRFDASYDKIFGTKTHTLPQVPTVADGDKKTHNLGETLPKL